MASAVRQITSVGGDIRKIARLLQKKAPPGHMLAYINQEEADLLKARGGSGEPHADTGVPSFQNEDLSPIETATPDPTPAYVPAGPDVTESPDPAAAPFSTFPTAEVATPTRELSVPEQYAEYGAGRQAAEAYRPELTLAQQYAQYGAGRQAAEAKPDLDLLGRASKATGFSEDTLKKLGISGLQGLIGAYQANKAQQAGQAGKEELSALAAPYRQQGQEMVGKAQRGELTPVGQQQLQAVQAQAAQGAERRGGVGAQQSMAQVEAFRQQLLQGQYDYGLKLSGIGDNIMTGAIKAGMQADQYANDLTSSYFSNMARIMANVEEKKKE